MVESGEQNSLEEQEGGRVLCGGASYEALLFLVLVLVTFVASVVTVLLTNVR